MNRWEDVPGVDDYRCAERAFDELCRILEAIAGSLPTNRAFRRSSAGSASLAARDLAYRAVATIGGGWADEDGQLVDGPNLDAWEDLSPVADRALGVRRRAGPGV